MSYVIAAVVVIGIIVGIVLTTKRNNEIIAHGIEADGVVSRIESDTDSDGDTTYKYYVKYATQACTTVEAVLAGRIPDNLYQGQELRIKYLPEKPKVVVAL